MAWIEQRRRAEGGPTVRMFWRPGGCRNTTRVWETFSAGSDAQNLARADGFKRMVEAAGQRWPDGWVEREGFVRPPDVADPMTPPPSFDEIGEEYVRQIVDLSPGQRKRYLGQLQVLARTPVLDVAMPTMSGLQAAREIARRTPHPKMLMLSMYDNEQYFFEALSAGACGYVLKSVADQDLVHACHAAARGESSYTRGSSAH
ncbi:MAG TPA: response regulator transcription factor [Propionibacteriaceae bacterium]|nr:response regulator transcription factor [Propionibacteriaceae bacterium]